MLRTFFKNWWVLTLKGTLLVVFGILCFANPGVAILSLALWFSLLLMIDGVLSLIAVFSHWKETEDKWLLVVEGGVSLLLGIMLWRNPEASLLLVAMTVAIWAFFSGISRIAMAIQLRKEMEGEFWLGLSGVLILLLGVAIVAQPAIGIAGLAWLIGLATLFAGIVLIVLSLKIRKGGHWLNETAREAKSKLDELKSRTK